jgi:hypothetical protein
VSDDATPVERYVIARPAAYKVLRVTPDEVEVAIVAGSDRAGVVGRTLVWPRAYLRAMLACGDAQLVRGRPAWIDTIASAHAGTSARDATGKTADGTKKRTVRKGKAR